MRFPGILLVAVLTVATSCSRAPVITVTNQSSLTLSNVVVSGSGFTNRFPRIPPGAERRFRVQPRGESDVRVVFDAGTRHVDSGEQGYFEAGGGYRVAATIDTNLNVFISSDLRHY